MRNRVADAASLFVRGGISVVPVRGDGSKAPTLPWKEFQERVASEDEVRSWFTEGGDGAAAGVAVVCGRVSGNLEVLDFDEVGLFDEWLALAHDLGLGFLVESLPLVGTPSGGRHLYYRCEAPVDGNRKLALRRDPVPEGVTDEAELRKLGARRDPVTGEWYVAKVLIETRGEGGYAIAPPSPANCHPAGEPYRLLAGDPTNPPVLTAGQRARLLDLARAFNEHLDPAPVVHGGAAGAPAPDSGTAGSRPGDDFNRRGDLPGPLERHGWRLLFSRGETGYWQRPGKQGPGCSATLNHAGSGLLHVFSTSAAPFEGDTAYTPFAAYALLEHGGDWAAAARALAERGYGEQQQQRTKPARVARAANAAPRSRHEGKTVPEGEDEAAPAPTVVCLSDVKKERVDWLWKGRLAYGKTTLLDGDPGLGKSTGSLDLAARLSCGGPMPGCAETFRPGDTLLLSAEDGLADTIRPRLEAAGADLSRVHALTEVPDAGGQPRLPVLPDDIPLIEAMVASVNARLVVIDPLMAYLSGNVNSFRDQDVRRALAPLGAMAGRTGAAVLVLRHLNKGGGGSALYRGGGSIGIAGAARSVLLVAKDPDDEKKRVLVQVKNNLAPIAPALGFHLDSVGEGAAAFVAWDGEVATTADELLAAQGTDGDRGPREEAEGFLRDLLAEGPVEASAVHRAARDNGVSPGTLNRAKERLGIKPRKSGFGAGGRWEWSLPPRDEGAPCAKAPNDALRYSPPGDEYLGATVITLDEDGAELVGEIRRSRGGRTELLL